MALDAAQQADAAANAQRRPTDDRNHNRTPATLRTRRSRPQKTPHETLPRATRDAQRRQEKLNKPDHAAYEAAYAHPTADPDELCFRHEHWGPTRACVDATLEAIGTNPRQLDAFRNCGLSASSATARLPAATTLRRLLPLTPLPTLRTSQGQPPGRKPAKPTRRGPRPSYRFVTLTLRHTNTPLAHQLKRLTQSFRDLRRTQLWKQPNTAAPPLSKSNGTRRPNVAPHLHIVSEGAYLSKTS